MSQSKEYYRDYYQKNKEKFKERSKTYRELNKETILKKELEYKLKFPEKLLLKEAKKRAKKFNIPFNIEESDIVIPELCPILGIQLRSNIGTGQRKDDSYSLDRIDPSKGYTKGNVQVISDKANRMKKDGSATELKEFARWVVNTFGLI